jgi:uncharacterized protein YaaW (UPF0174 family)
MRTREELDDRMLEALKVKAKVKQEGMSLDMVSLKVIEEAASLLDIPKDLTPAQKADSVYQRFYERLLDNLQKQLKKQDDKSAAQTREALQNSLDNMNEEQRHEIRKALNIEKLTGETIRSALLKACSPTAILAIASASGFGAFVALTTIIHAIFTTIIGITLPFVVYSSATSVLVILIGPVGGILIFVLASYQILSGSKKLDRELLAQVVWISVSSYGGMFTPNEESLPSWVANEDKEKAVALVKKCRSKIEELIQK